MIHDHVLFDIEESSIIECPATWKLRGLFWPQICDASVMLVTLELLFGSSFHNFYHSQPIMISALHINSIA